MNNSKQDVYIFDICGTLYQSNTTFDFLSWLFINNKQYKFFSQLYKTFIWRCFNKILRDLFHLDVTRIIAVRFMKGYKRRDLEMQATTFVKEYLEHKKNENIINELYQLQNSGQNVLLLSATIDVIAKAIATSLNVKHYRSSRLAYDNEVCMGKLDCDLFGNKLSYVTPSENIKAVYTDDLSDFSLINKARIANVITYKRTERRWSNTIPLISSKIKIWKM